MMHGRKNIKIPQHALYSQEQSVYWYTLQVRKEQIKRGILSSQIMHIPDLASFLMQSRQS